CHSDYLPLSQGDTGLLQPVGFANLAGQTQKNRLVFKLAVLICEKMKLLSFYILFRLILRLTD
ncbi:hypothetical protein, partial [Oligella urethralis]